MKKLVFGTCAVFAAISLNAAVIATVNGQDVSDEDIGLLLRQFPNVSYEKLPEDAKQQVLNQAIDRKLLIENAIKNGIEKDKEFISTLEKVKNEIALEIWMKKEFEKVKVSDSSIKKFYDENQNTFVQPERVKASHILVNTEDEAKKIIKELGSLKGKAMIDKFAEFAKSNVDQTSQTGGDLGWFSKNDPFIAEFKNAAFALKKGEVSKAPVKTQFGYHVIYLEDKQAEKKLPFDEVKEQIANGLKGEEFRKNIEVQAKALRDKAKIEIKK
ncbi:MAG: peptidyl-prolyl cis-trans isomerase [Campylobacteraceae bacterium]|jgi:parvulin-like peptidyl-prolyl isomerase|nr:peptidyl-prolyl cis-trans isomerase [Campylobacteraceae bacterium]